MQIKFQKTPWRHDPRSNKFSHEKFFGSIRPQALPATLGRVRGPVLNQRQTLRCTGYGSAANGYYIHGIEMSPDWQAYKIGQIQGKSVDEYAGDPNACMKSMRDYGFLPKSKAPFSLENNGIEGSGFRAPWPASLDEEARKYDLMPGYVRVDGPYDHFDNIRNALFVAYDPTTGKGACVDAFGRWFLEWGQGIIPSSYNVFGGYHRYVFIDWLYLDGVCYLVAQNSYGEGYGDKGFHLFPREVVNREFGESGTTLKILKVMSRAEIEEAKKETSVGYLWRLILQAWYNLSIVYGRHS